MEGAGQPTNLGSDSGKLRAFGVSDNGGVSEFPSAPLCLYGALVNTYKSGEYITVLGRHLVPNIFHKEELRRLMISGRRAAAAIRVGGLPANYPLLMYSARAGGYHRWLGGIRPPIASVGRLGDIPVATNLRSLLGGGDTDSAVFLRPIAGGGLGLDPSAVTILSTFLVTYTKQLNHPHETVRSSVRHGLRSA